MRTLTTPDTLVPEIDVIMAIPHKCVAVLFGMSPEGEYSTVSNQSLKWVLPTQIVLWINTAANIIFLITTPETARIQIVNSGVGE